MKMIQTSLFRGTTVALGLAVALLGSAVSHAQQALGPMVFSVGTTWREPATGKDWGYMLWLGNETRLLIGRTFSVYAKQGDVNSPALYRRVALIASQTDPLVIAPLLQRAASIGDNLAVLEGEIDEVFRKFVPVNATLAEKISAAIRGALDDEEHFSRLVLMARSHPAMAMALGVAHAEPIGAGVTTFELRQHDPKSKDDQHVVGRVTVEAGAPTVLPAPGQPVLIPQPGPTGDMNTKLRWATPDELRRVSLLQNGFDVWRVRRDFAESPLRQWNVTQPTPDVLLNYAYSTSAVRKLTQDSPVLVGKHFNAAEVADFNADSNTVFYTDADLRGLPGVEAGDFVNGAEFYYFVAARDVLGRDGLISPGRLAKICDRLFPDALSGVEVNNDFAFVNNAPKHHLRVLWPQAKNAPGDEELIQRYWIYRWTNVNELRLNMDNPNFNLIGIVNHQAGQEKGTYLDDGANSPGLAQLGKTFWYTVRAEDSGACGGNLSPHSGPVPGVLRDREGPPPGTGHVGGNCYDPAVFILPRGTNNTGTTEPGSYLTVRRIRVTPRIAWMDLEVVVREDDGTNVLRRFTAPRHYFAKGENTNSADFFLPAELSLQRMTIAVRAGHVDDRTTEAFREMEVSWGRGDRLTVEAYAGLVPGRTQDCGTHDPIDPVSGGIKPIDVTVIPSVGSRELRMYRRVNDGPLTMICQKTWSPTNSSPLVCSDDAFPATTAKICYFVQLFDEHGNGGALSELGCSTVLSPESLPKPMMAAIKPQGSDSQAKMKLRWFGSVQGVERFEVGVCGLNVDLADNAAPGQLSPTGKIEQHNTPKHLAKGKYPDSNANDFKIFRTPVVGRGSSFGTNSEFNLEVNIQPDVKYVVFIRARGKDGTAGPISNLEGFTWVPPHEPSNEPTNGLPTVAWPARPLPVISNSFSKPFVAAWLTNSPSGHIGAVITLGGWVTTNTPHPTPSSNFGARPQVLRGVTDPTEFMETNELGSTALPLVLYRYQVPSTLFPKVSGDLIQASPLLERVAFQQTYTNGTPHAVIHDPFFLFDGMRLNFASTYMSIMNSYLKDTQPVIRGARYRYLVTRFRSDGEIAEVIPTNEIEIP